MTDCYASFSELEKAEKEGVEWTREYVDRGSDTVVLAPHGGWIEPYTAELAVEIAGSDLSLYAFRGLKEGGNRSLHLTSHRFDEPLALKAAASARWVLAVHGEKTRDLPFVMVGGLWVPFGTELIAGLSVAGFHVEDARPGLGGVNPMNICNRGRTGMGGQLELSEALRRDLRHDADVRAAFVGAVRGAVRAATGRGIQAPSSHPEG